MMAKAVALSQSKIPAEFDNKKVRAAVNKLAADSKKLNKLVQSKGKDDAIKKSLSDLHDTFHLIVETCSHNE